uniref:(northern house mosquito) hypothetical protein n=1 Tax=Culex pipiens TaxID=7175 RepID=A0A8D8P1T5_CULPI
MEFATGKTLSVLFCGCSPLCLGIAVLVSVGVGGYVAYKTISGQKSENQKGKSEPSKNNTKDTGPKKIIKPSDKDGEENQKRPKRATTPVAPDESSETTDMRKVRSLMYHFKKRLTRFVRLSAMAQYISEQTSIARDKFLCTGKSQYQDRYSRMGHAFHASHVVRVHINNADQLESRNAELFEMLKNFLGHTHLMPRYANEWNGVGGRIDRIQEDFLEEINTIDFSRPLNTQVRDMLQRLKDEFLKVFKSLGVPKNIELMEIVEVIETIDEISIEELFKKGKSWYDNKNKNEQHNSDSDASI